jgi:pyruvate dehydrogenase (quinone)
MAETVGDYLLKRLAQWGVRRIYGYPGEDVNGLIGAFGRGGSGIEFVSARHEELAAFMACAHAKFSGEVGVCLASSGPGAIHLLNGLYDARLDRQPVLAIVGQQRHAGATPPEVDLRSLFDDLAHELVHVATTPQQLPQLIDRAMLQARDERTVCCLIVPGEVQEMPADATAQAAPIEGIGPIGRSVVAADAELRRAAEILNLGERVALLVGAGALHATDEVIEVAERLGAGIAKSLAGKAAVPDDLPHVTGTVGLLGSKPSWDLLERCDTLLMIGAGLSYAEFLAAERQARGVQIDPDPRLLSPGMEVGLVGDSKATLAALLPYLEHKADRRFRQQIERDVARWWQVLGTRAMAEAEPINPERVFSELSPRLPENCIVTCDAGSCAHWFARDLRLRRGMSAALSGGHSRMGSAVPYAIAAKYAQPHRPVIALLGDGAMQMNGINGLITIAQLWREWANPRLTIMVLNNGESNDAGWEQRVLEGEPVAEASAQPEFPYAAYAELIGLRGLRVDHAEAVAPAWASALGGDIPTVLEMVTDPRVAPLPPHVAPQQARAYLAALRHGDSAALGVVRATARDWWDGIVAGRH